MTPPSSFRKLLFGHSIWSKPVRWLKQVLAELRRILLTRGIRGIYRLRGIQFLNKKQTDEFLASSALVTYPPDAVFLPEVTDAGQSEKIYFPATLAEPEPVSVWHYNVTDRHTYQLPYGGIVAQQQVLCLDVNDVDFFRNVLNRQKRTSRHTPTLIAPWSHYQDGFMWGGYYDFVLLVLGKLCRMKDVLPETTFDEALVAYPLFGTSYEREYLALLGIPPDRVVDSRTTSVTFDRCVLADVGHWFYPNPADIHAIRKHILSQFPAPAGKRNRVYMSRAGRRSILNETELIALLKAYDFQIIEDVPRSVAEQVAIYQQAEFIIGPHGASMTNILWCQPGTHLFELFSPAYYPEFFRYMAGLLGLHYSAYFHGPAETDDWALGLTDNILVSIPEVEKYLMMYLTTSPEPEAS
ncbi:glycosyltransferase family 61 protein [Spirosoma sp. KUDC1026]|uniref:glycosyltransferase family 61 protein n=1 Tax=Spirosoma sp. KUDC1026 TaxID=2745947 RepID=UPI00159BEEBB|nr:glycosyltransferase family 61 protein [Spirosoma sp. KUDC1026]QKZ15587.1 glycosyltransferase family 61 protein [Spirosoma sp. KUDC1026]